MDERRDSFPPAVGGSSLLVIFAVLCLTVFALLGLATVQANSRLSDASAQTVSGYYAADCQAETILAQLRSGTVPEGVSVRGDVYSYTCPISDTQTLQVEVRVDESAYTILCWQAVSTADWQAEEDLEVWGRRVPETDEEEATVELVEYLKQAVADRASDLFIVAGGVVSEKAEGRLRPIGTEKVFPPETEHLISEIYKLANRPMDRYQAAGDDDFSFAVPGLARFRVNAYRQRGSMAAVVRVVSFEIPDWKSMGIPETVMDFADTGHGMVLVTGTAGSGKSTTQACIIDRINRTREAHIITLEDPIEFLHRDQRSIVSQREIAIDTADYLSALRACLRQAPDVILLGEMRDHETIRTAMTAAETGHLLIATLHTKGAVNTIDRIVDAFPPAQQAQIRVQLSMVLRTVVSQQLLPDQNGGLVPAFEIMHMTPAIRSMIRDSKSHQIDNAIAAGSNDGM